MTRRGERQREAPRLQATRSRPSAAARLLPPAAGWLAVLADGLLPAGSWQRSAPVLLLLLLAPGAALLVPLRGLHGRPPAPGARLERAVLAVLLSLCADVLVGTALLVAGAFAAGAELRGLAALTTAAALAPPWRSGRSSAPARRPARDRQAAHDRQAAPGRAAPPGRRSPGSGP